MSAPILKKFRESKQMQIAFCLFGILFSVLIVFWTSGVKIGNLFPSQSRIEEAAKELKKANAAALETEQKLKVLLDNEKAYKELQSTFWDVEKDGDPDLELRKKLEEAAKKFNFKLNSVGSVRHNRINSELAFLEVDLAATETLETLTSFANEIENTNPRMYWKKFDLNPENLQDSDRLVLAATIRLICREAAAGNSQKAK